MLWFEAFGSPDLRNYTNISALNWSVLAVLIDISVHNTEDKRHRIMGWISQKIHSIITAEF